MKAFAPKKISHNILEFKKKSLKNISKKSKFTNHLGGTFDSLLCLDPFSLDFLSSQNVQKNDFGL
jgi:hypothetical protein